MTGTKYYLDSDTTTKHSDLTYKNTTYANGAYSVRLRVICDDLDEKYTVAGEWNPNG